MIESIKISSSILKKTSQLIGRHPTALLVPIVLPFGMYPDSPRLGFGARSSRRSMYKRQRETLTAV